jgi:toxin ParE1/3/4
MSLLVPTNGMARTDRTIVWSGDAERDIDGIWDYLAAQASIQVADDKVRDLFRVCDRLISHPFLGRPRDELIPGLRSILAHPHIVFYRVAGSNIEVVRVLHQRRDIEAIFRP